MANWDKLSKELKDVLENMTDEDWNIWKENQKKNQELRRKKNELLMEQHLKFIKEKNGRI